MPPLILHAYPASPKPQSIYDADESLSPEKGLRTYYYPTTTRRQCSTHAYNGGATRGAVRCGRGVGVGASTKRQASKKAHLVARARQARGRGARAAASRAASLQRAARARSGASRRSELHAATQTQARTRQAAEHWQQAACGWPAAKACARRSSRQEESVKGAGRPAA